MQKITPCLWFNDQAEEAVAFYISIFKNSKITHVSHYTQSTEGTSGRPAGSVLTVGFTLDGQEFVAMNGGPNVNFSMAISLMVNCKDQAELDEIWNKLSADPKAEQCGWLKDKYGLSWQIVPAEIIDLITNEATTDKVMAELIKMHKLNIATLKQAAKAA